MFNFDLNCGFRLIEHLFMDFYGLDNDVELEMFPAMGEARVHGWMEVKLVCVGLMVTRRILMSIG